MSKSKRLIELFMVVNTKRKFTVKELAEEFGVSKRTMIRDLQELSELGVPLYSEVGAAGGYQVLREKTLPPIRFTEDEAIAMFFAYHSLEQYADLPFEASSISVLKKFYHYLPSEAKVKIDNLKNRFLFKIPNHPISTPFLKTILEAALEQHVISITYDSESGISDRDIQVVGVYSANGLWYAPSFCFKSNEYRLFRIDRITVARTKDDQTCLKDLQSYTLSEWFAYQQKKHAIDLEVKLTARGVKRCQSDIWLSSDVTVLPDGTGMIQTSIDPPYLSWAVNFFFRLW
ncbi:WYL domain-containing protein [Cohnella sp. CFH 77786]|uniref:helix-turn-helix transcriptional regulator n=1 Tax=Cohnella sp. CFH 77786 TaxID=2662265 RepID=UPI001C60C0EE|nr:YafY family protein [Cohnella sp. CFH 77786]MBW5449457.1 WYL domain-containing protein [Cohnella sp. CFH 77786]